MSKFKMNTRNRLLIVERLLLEYREKGIWPAEIQRIIFDRYGIDVNRKLIYNDIQALQLFLNIKAIRVGNHINYKVVIKEKTAPQQSGTVPKQKQKTSREVTK